jgi:hypothetical protein
VDKMRIFKILLLLVLLFSPAIASPFDDMLPYPGTISIVDINKSSGETTIQHTDGTWPVDITGWELKYENRIIELNGILNKTEKMVVSTPFNSSQARLRTVELTSPLLEDMRFYR